MDRSIYVSMTGVKHLFDQQAASANNLANASTTRRSSDPLWWAPAMA